MSLMQREERLTQVAVSIGVLVGLAINALAVYGFVTLLSGS